jgi:2-dehydropantoate 2-reductase
MRIAIVGAGAIGSWLGVRLAEAGQRVSIVARGETLAALQQNGLRLTADDEIRNVEVVASGDASELGEQDLVVVAVKSHSLRDAAPAIAAMCGAETCVLPAMNGVPWWFTHGLEGVLAGAGLRSVDPDGSIARLVPPSRVIGCVVHASCSLATRGHAVHTNGNRLIIGEPEDEDTARLEKVHDVLKAAQFDVTVSERIHKDVWYKLWGNMTMNPISVLTGALTDQILREDLVKSFAHAVMEEAAEIGRRIGCPIAESSDDRIKVTEKLGGIKTSMLQDAQAGRPLEIDALLAAPREIAARVGVATPNMDALHGLINLYAAVRAEARGTGA